MNSFIIRKLEMLLDRHKTIEILLNTVDIINNQDQFRILSKEYSHLTNIVSHFNYWKKIQDDICTIKKLTEDEEIRSLAQDELKQFYIISEKIEKELQLLLIPVDPDDTRGCLLEIRAGTGGNEASLFALDLFRMYSRYSERLNWKIEVVNFNYSEYGGYKEIVARLPYKGAYGKFKFESGGHRVQRIPNTESQGRVHTSSCTVAVMPEIPESEFPVIDPGELRIDTFRSSGAGGQHVNTTDSAIRITHIPTGLVVECQDERSQHKNKSKALSVLHTRLYDMEKKRRHQEESYTRRNLLGSGDRSDRIRTYNFSQRRITDHRTGFTIYKLDEVIEGNLELLSQSLIQKYQAEKLEELLKHSL